MSKEINKTLEKYYQAEKSLQDADNNWKHIRSLNRMKMYLDRFYELLTDDEKLNSEFAAIYEALFYTGFGFSVYDRVCNSILDYSYGNRPF